MSSLHPGGSSTRKLNFHVKLSSGAYFLVGPRLPVRHRTPQVVYRGPPHPSAMMRQETPGPAECFFLSNVAIYLGY